MESQQGKRLKQLLSEDKLVMFVIELVAWVLRSLWTAAQWLLPFIWDVIKELLKYTALTLEYIGKAARGIRNYLISSRDQKSNLTGEVFDAYILQMSKNPAERQKGIKKLSELEAKHGRRLVLKILKEIQEHGVSS